MKKISILGLLIIAISLVSFKENRINSTKPAELEGTITLSGAFALYPLAVKWADEYKKLHPKVRIDISAGGAGKGMTDALAGMVDIGMLSRDVNPVGAKKGAYAIAVTKDAVVPVINEKNPAIKDILAKGLKQSDFLGIFVAGTTKTWGQALGNKNTSALHAFTRSDACGAGETWAKYLNGKKQEELIGTGVFGDPGLATAVKNDALGIGYNNIAYAYDSKTKKQLAGIRIVPIDLNNNGKIDSDENFYGTIDDLTKAIAIGKYPSPPARDLLFVTKEKPTKPLVKDFINWVLTDGQKFVHEAGYINLSKDKIKEAIKRVN